MTPVLVLLNPSADGGKAAALAAPMRSWLAAHAPSAGLIESEGIVLAQAMLLALRPESRVVLVGGDGTLHQMLPALLARRHTLGLVPAGGSNDAARALGLGRTAWEDALRHALEAAATPIDVGEMSAARIRVPFFSNLCAGFDAVSPARGIGGSSSPGTTARRLWRVVAGQPRHAWDLRITVDGSLRHAGKALFASTCNAPTFGGGTASQAAIDDGRLELLLATGAGRLGALRTMKPLLAGSPLRPSRVRTWGFESLHVSSPQPVPLSADGEHLGSQAEFEVRVRPRALAVAIDPERAALASAAAAQAA